MSDFEALLNKGVPPTVARRIVAGRVAPQPAPVVPPPAAAPAPVPMPQDNAMWGQPQRPLGVAVVVTPLERERAEEDAALSQPTSPVIASVHYTYDNDGDYRVTFKTNWPGDVAYVVVVVLADKGPKGLHNRSEMEAVARFLKLGVRGASINESIFLGWASVVRQKISTCTVKEIRSPGKHVAVVLKFEPVRAVLCPGRVRVCQFGLDKDKDMIVRFNTDLEQFQLIVRQEVVDGSVSRLQAKAFAEALSVGLPGNCMDEGVFLQYCAQFNHKYNIFKAYRVGDVLLGHVYPTSLSAQQSGAGFSKTGMVDLPAVSPGPVELSPLTLARAEAYQSSRHFNVQCDGCGVQDFQGKRFKCQTCDSYDLCQSCFSSNIQTKAHVPRVHQMTAIDQPGSESMMDVLSNLFSASIGGPAPAAQAIAGVVAQSDPLKAERLYEEFIFSQAVVASRQDVISSLTYKFDRDGDFRVTLERATETNFQYHLCVIISEKGKITYKECRAIRDCLKLGERGTSLTEAEFMAWQLRLNSVHGRAELRRNEAGHNMAIVIRPPPPRGVFRASQVQATNLIQDDTKCFYVVAQAGSDIYSVCIFHEDVGGSFSKQQGRALMAVLSALEPGMAISENIFLQMCSRFKKQFSIVTVSRQADDNSLYCSITPSMLSDDRCGVDTASPVPLPPATDEDLNAVLVSPPATPAMHNAFPVAAVPPASSPEPVRGNSPDAGETRHVGVTCAVCGASDFTGKRHQCAECTDYDLCHTCFDASRESKSHKADHLMRTKLPPIKDSPTSSSSTSNGRADTIWK